MLIFIPKHQGGNSSDPSEKLPGWGEGGRIWVTDGDTAFVALISCCTHCL